MTGSMSSGSGRASWGMALAFLLVACGVRVTQSVLARDAFATDRDNYRQLAENVLRRGVYGFGDRPSAFRPPLYPLALAAVFSVAPPREAAAGLHLALGIATILAVYLAARLLGLGDWSILAALSVAFDPVLLNQSKLFMTETMAALFTAVAWLLLVVQAKRPRLGVAIAAGIVLGLASLCRPTFVPWWIAVALVAVAWPAALGGRKTALAFACAAAACLLPWTLRNQWSLGAPIPTTTHGGYTLLLANNPEFYEFAQSGPWGGVWPSEKLDAQLLATLPAIETPADEVSNDLRCRAMAMDHIRAAPEAFAWASLVRAGRFWGLLPHQLDPGESWPNRLLRYSVAVEYSVSFLLALLGLASLGKRLLQPPWVWALVAALSFTAVHAVYWSDLRMRAPLAPVIACAAAAGASVCWRLVNRSKPSQTPDLGGGDSIGGSLDPQPQPSL